MSAQAPGVVLYVEDEEGDRFFMQRAFIAAGLDSTLQIVSDGDAAIQYLSGTGAFADRTKYPIPRLVLLDLNLPQTSGFEVLEWIRKQPALQGLPLVIFSSSPRDEDRIRARQMGADEYWEKPGSGLLYEQIALAVRDRWLLKLAALQPEISPTTHGLTNNPA